ncbi:MAG: DUF1887 family protein [SAR324 cluster bacterium]|nr:DUF1887 family protein [SAR324 cluster bacterium]
MPKHLVSLVSDQTLPNLLLIQEFGDIDQYWMISTEKMERQGRSDWIIRASGKPDTLFRKIIVIEDSLQDIAEKLKVEITASDIHFLINLTGGTKIMSLGVYAFFNQLPHHQFYYIPGGRNDVLDLAGTAKQQHISYSASVGDFLAVYGIQTSSSGTSVLHTPDYTCEFLKHYQHLGEDDFKILNQLRTKRKQNRLTVNTIPGLSECLKRMNYPVENDQLLRADIRYLTGDWFEEYVYAACQSVLQLPASHIAMGIEIKREKTVSGDEVPNEFDVIFTRNNKLYVIECKTSIFSRHVEAGINILDETLYKLGALKQDFGLYPQSFVFTLSHLGEKKNQIRPHHLKRANYMNIKVIDGSILKDSDRLAKFIKDLI